MRLILHPIDRHPIENHARKPNPIDEPKAGRRARGAPARPHSAYDARAPALLYGRAFRAPWQDTQVTDFPGTAPGSLCTTSWSTGREDGAIYVDPIQGRGQEPDKDRNLLVTNEIKGSPASGGDQLMIDMSSTASRTVNDQTLDNVIVIEGSGFVLARARQLVSLNEKYSNGAYCFDVNVVEMK
jgi:hypothetical protein